MRPRPVPTAPASGPEAAAAAGRLLGDPQAQQQPDGDHRADGHRQQPDRPRVGAGHQHVQEDEHEPDGGEPVRVAPARGADPPPRVERQRQRGDDVGADDAQPRPQRPVAHRERHEDAREPGPQIAVGQQEQAVRADAGQRGEREPLVPRAQRLGGPGPGDPQDAEQPEHGHGGQQREGDQAGGAAGQPPEVVEGIGTAHAASAQSGAGRARPPPPAAARRRRARPRGSARRRSRRGRAGRPAARTAAPSWPASRPRRRCARPRSPTRRRSRPGGRWTGRAGGGRAPRCRRATGAGRCPTWRWRRGAGGRRGRARRRASGARRRPRCRGRRRRRRSDRRARRPRSAGRAGGGRAGRRPGPCRCRRCRAVTPAGRRTRRRSGETHRRCQDAAGAGRAARRAGAPASARSSGSAGPVQWPAYPASAISLTERGVDQAAAAAPGVDRRGDEGADDRVHRAASRAGSALRAQRSLAGSKRVSRASTSASSSSAAARSPSATHSRAWPPIAAMMRSSALMTPGSSAGSWGWRRPEPLPAEVLGEPWEPDGPGGPGALVVVEEVLDDAAAVVGRRWSSCPSDEPALALADPSAGSLPSFDADGQRRQHHQHGDDRAGGDPACGGSSALHDVQGGRRTSSREPTEPERNLRA